MNIQKNSCLTAKQNFRYELLQVCGNIEAAEKANNFIIGKEQTEVATTKNNMPDGVYLVYADGAPVLFEDGVSDENVIGVGLKMGDKSIIVALEDEANGKEITLTAASDKTNYDGYISSYREINKDWSGKKNTEHLKGIGLNEKIDLNDDWYIPSMAELRFIHLFISEINEALQYVGGAPLSFDWYWTSTEGSATNAWFLYLGGGDASSYSKASYTGRVRAVSAFIN